MRKPEYLAVWIDLLLSANHKDKELIFNEEKILIKSGSFITSRAKIAANTDVEESKVERILKYLKTEQQIEQQSFNKFRIISICNWPKYQQSEQQSEQPVNSQRTASEQPVNTNKNEKNVKNKNNNGFKKPTVEEIRIYCTERNNTVDPQVWLSHYESNGWLVGKNKMKDWKAAVRTWERSEYTKPPEVKSRWD
jgi:hydroxymethylpyrimidine pyrophosphatase-like HAD family hydrolase